MAPIAAKLFPDQLMQAISWTIIHSLWQGVVLAVLAAAVIHFTKRSAPALRYNLLALLLVSFLATTALTFGWQYFTPGYEKGAAATKLEADAFVAVTVHSFPSEATGKVAGAIQAFSAFCNAHAAVIALLWFLVFLYKCVRIVAGVKYISHLRGQAAELTDSYWQSKVAQLAKLLQIKVPVQLLQSELIQVPVVIGFLKPLILVPAGMLAQINPEQVEAILLHELAHIRRRDYLVNLLQSFIEVVYFFNPAILWVSALIRQERENCCDDIAIAAVQSKSKFLQALVTFQEYSFANNALVPAFAGRQGSLTDRVRRIIYENNTPLLRSEKFFLTSCLLVVGAVVMLVVLPERSIRPAKLVAEDVEVLHNPLAAASSISEEAPEPKATSAAKVKGHKPELYTADDLPEGGAHKSFDGDIAHYRFKKGGILYEVDKAGEQVLALKVNGKLLGASEIATYKSLMLSLQEQLQQGKIEIVVNGRVPETDAEPENPVMVGFIRNGTITTDREGTIYKLGVRDHKTVELSVNDKAVALSEIQYHKALIDDLVQEALSDRIYAELSYKALDQINRKKPGYENTQSIQKHPAEIEPSSFKFQVALGQHEADAFALALAQR